MQIATRQEERGVDTNRLQYRERVLCVSGVIVIERYAEPWTPPRSWRFEQLRDRHNITESSQCLELPTE